MGWEEGRSGEVGCDVDGMRWDGHGDLTKKGMAVGMGNGMGDGWWDGMSGIRDEMKREQDITGDGIWDGLIREMGWLRRRAGLLHRMSRDEKLDGIAGKMRWNRS